MSAPDATEVIEGATPSVRELAIEVVDGPSLGRRREGTRVTVGSAPENDLVLDDATVSRFHCELSCLPGVVRVRDLESKNGTTVDGVRVIEAAVRHDSLLRLGRSVVRVRLTDRAVELPVSAEPRFGMLYGTSFAMRSAFAVLERAAASDVTVLLEGETGTGKEGAARALHDRGRRAGAPFIVLDCGAMPGNLIEAELFGAERGAFTGADARRVGAFEAAAGGTILLDEIGELPLELQPKLLRVLERHEIRRLGATDHIPVDVRVIAATNRDLRAEVNAGTFRTDVYFRLAVMRIELPPLREHPEDLPGLVAQFCDTQAVAPELAAQLRAPAYLAALATAAWPGNVRELRNLLERSVVLGTPLPPGSARREHSAAMDIDLGLGYREAKQRLLDAFDLRYVEALMKAHHGNVTAAAREAGLSRMSLYAIMRRHGLK